MSFLRREQMDCCNYVEAMGSKILVDSKSNWMYLESLEGNTTQVQTTGAQLFDISNPSSAINQWVITDKRISITNPTSGYLTVIYTINVKPSTTYTIYSIIVNDTPDANNMNITITLLKEDGTTQDNIVILNNTSSAKFTTTVDTKSIFIYFRNRTTGNGGYFEDIILNEGETTVPWEPYTGGKPSPSVEYPQNINGINLVNINIQGTQILDLSNINVYNDEVAVIGNNNGYTITGEGDITVSFEKRIKTDLKKFLKPGKITLKSIITLPRLYVTLKTTGKDWISLNGNVTREITQEMLDDENSYVEIMFFASVNSTSKTLTPGTYYPMLYQEGDGTYQPYYNPQIVPLTFTEPLNKIGDYADEITSVKRINRCIELTFDGSENWGVRSDELGFQLLNGLPYPMNRREGFCNQYFVETKKEINKPQVWLGINNNLYVYAVYNEFFDDTLADKGLSAWKAHLSTNPLKVITYTNPEGYVETPLEQSNIDGIKSLYAYDGYTIINNNENTNMKIMYKTKS